MKKWLKVLSICAVTLTLGACGSDEQEAANESGAVNESLGAIDVVSREEGSGARGAFEEIVGFNQTDDDDQIVDPLVTSATIKDGNGVVATHVMGNEAAIGYVTMFTLDENQEGLKGLLIDGVEPTIEHVIDGSYPVIRPFNMVYMEENLTEIEEAFIAYTQSADAVYIMEQVGGIADEANRADFDQSAYEGLAGTLVLGGSTSVEEVAKSLANEFSALFPGVDFTYDATGSSAGVNNAISGTYAIGFASREIKESELESKITAEVICLDGMAIVVNPSNPITDLTLEEIKEIYTGVISDWSAVTK